MAKKELFNEELQSVSAYFKTLGHPARLAILQYLAETRVCMSGDISKELPLSRTTVGQHLKDLKDLGLIQGEVEGVKVNYCLHEPGIRNMKKRMLDILDRIGECKCCECE